MKRTMMILTTSILLSGAAPLALASQISGSLDWASLQVELTDLDASDGVTPNITWTDQYTGVNVLVIPPGGVIGQGAADWTSAVSVTQGPASAAASASSLTVDLTGMSPTIDYAESHTARWGDFSLTPKTQVRFVLPAQLTVANLASFDLSAGAGISVFDGTNFFFDDLNATNGDTFARSLELIIQNTTINGLDAHFNASLGFNAQPTPVPLPGSWTMMLAGLGLVGWRARLNLRRR